MNVEKANRILMKSNSSYSERWLQSQLVLDPSILNLGDIFLKDQERRQIWEIYQIGITNVPEDRLNRHSKNGFELLELRGPMDGHIQHKN
jgi:hypothetical protein